MRLRSLCRLLVMILAVGGLSIVSLSSSTATAKPGSSPLPDATEELAAHYLAANYSVSIDEARAQMSRQVDLLSLSQEIQADTGAVWAGARIDHQNGGALLEYSTDTAVTLKAAEADSPDLASLVVPIPVPSSFDQLRSEEDAIRPELAAAGVKTVAIGVQQSTNNVLVVLPTPAQSASMQLDAAAQYSKASDIASKYSDVAVSQEGGALTPASCSVSYEICSPPLRGGLELESDNGVACSTGLVVESKTDVKPYVLTAGHCTNGAKGSGPTSVWSTAYPDLNIHPIGTWHSSYYSWPNDDEALLNINNPSGYGLPTKSKVLVVSSGGTRPTVRDETYDIDNVGTSCISPCSAPIPLPQDTYLCWTGATYQTDCATFHMTDGYQGLLNVGNTLDYGVCDGDSGGPVYADHYAYGIVIGNTSNDYYVLNGDHRLMGNPSSKLWCSSSGINKVRYESMGKALAALNVKLVG